MIATARSTTSRATSSRVVMDPTLREGGVTVAHDRTPSGQTRSRRLTDADLPKARRESFEEIAARLMGCEVATVHRRRYQAPQDTALLIQAALEARDTALAAQFIAPSEAAIAGLAPLPLDVTICRTAFAADAEEDVTLYAFGLAVEAGRVTRADCDRMASDIRREIARKQELLAAITHHRESLA